MAKIMTIDSTFAITSCTPISTANLIPILIDKTLKSSTVLGCNLSHIEYQYNNPRKVTQLVWLSCNGSHPYETGWISQVDLIILSNNNINSVSLFHFSEDIIHVLFLDLEKIKNNSDIMLKIKREIKKTEYNVQIYFTNFPSLFSSKWT